MMMNDTAIGNIQRILQNEIAAGHAIIGIISVDENSRITLCWRTDDITMAKEWETGLKGGIGGHIDRALVNLPKEA